MARKLEVEIVGDSRSLERSLGRASNASAKFGSGMRTAIKGGALLAGAALGGLAVAAKVGFDEFKQGQLVTARTNAVLKSTGGVAGVSAAHINKLGDSMLRKSGVDDEVIRSGANVLLTFTGVRNEVGKGNQVFDRATQAALDLSVATGRDMSKSALVLGKALNDPIKGVSALTRIGVQFTDEQKKQIKALVDSGHALDAQKLVLAQVETRYKGTADAAGKTLPGQLNILKETFSNLAGEIVGRFVPPLIKVATFVAPLVLKALDGIGQLIDKFVAPQFGKVADVASREWPKIQAVASAVFGWIKQNVFPIVESLRDIWTAAVQQIGAVLEQHGPELQRIFDRVGAAVRALAVVAVPILRFIFVEVLPRAIGIAIDAIDKVSFAIEKGIEWAKKLGPPFQTAASTIVNVAGDIKSAWNTVVGFFQGLVNRLYEVALKIVGKIVEPFSHLPFGLGSWAQKAKREVEDKLAEIKLDRMSANLSAQVRAAGGSAVSAARAAGILVGSGLSEGAAAGIIASAERMRSAMVDAVDRTAAAARAHAGIKSPSLMFALQVGIPIAEGVAKGILDGSIKITEAMVNVVDRVRDVARGRLQNVFGNLQGWLSQAFSARQGAQLTPTEILINKKEFERQKDDLKDAIVQARADLRDAQAGDDPDAVKRAQKGLDDALYQQWLFDAQQKAAAERKDLENRQWVEQQHFEQRLANLQAFLESGHANAKTARAKILDLMADFGVKAGAAGQLLGSSFADGLRAMVPAVAKAAEELSAALRNAGIVSRGRKITVTIEAEAAKKKTTKKRAGGGPVIGGMTYLVGEHGPELFTAPSSGRVVPNDAAFSASGRPLTGSGAPAAARGGGAASVTYQFSFPHYVGSRDELKRAMRDSVQEIERDGNRLVTRPAPGFRS